MSSALSSPKLELIADMYVFVINHNYRRHRHIRE